MGSDVTKSQGFTLLINEALIIQGVKGQLAALAGIDHMAFGLEADIGTLGGLLLEQHASVVGMGHVFGLKGTLDPFGRRLGPPTGQEEGIHLGP